VLALRAAMLIIDPWNHVHGFADGNSNALMAQVAGEVNRIASETSAAVPRSAPFAKGRNW
jgi:hypothetical protein